MRILGVTASSIIIPGDFELIETSVLPSSTPSVSFNNLATYASTYKHLQVRITARSDHAGAAIISTRLNGDTASNYAWHSMFGNESGVNTGSVAPSNVMDTGLVPSATEAANVFSSSVFTFLDVYSTTKNKTLRALNGSVVSGANRINLFSGHHRSTAAITQITFSTYANYVAGSRFSLYGIKG